MPEQACVSCYGKICALGEIINERMHLSPWGQIVGRESPDHFINAGLDEFIIMPNHMHGIIEIVGAAHASPLRDPKKPGPPQASLGAIVGSFKSAATRIVNEMNGTPGVTFRQRNYYERVIRNDRELNLIRQYIEANPLKWELDRENPGYEGKKTGDEISEILQ